MFSIDEKLLADNKNLITIFNSKEDIDPSLKLGMIHYISDKNEFWVTNPETVKDYLESISSVINNKEHSVKKYDKLIIAKDGINISENLSFLEDAIFKKNVLVEGDFTVKGKTTVVDSENTSIKDNIVEFNKGELGEGISLNQGGIAINRGNKKYLKAVMSESDNGFILAKSDNVDGTEDDILIKIYTDNYLSNSKGDIESKNDLYIQNIFCKDKLLVKTLNVSDGISAKELTISDILNAKSISANDINTKVLNVEDSFKLRNEINFNDKYLLKYNNEEDSLVFSYIG